MGKSTLLKHIALKWARRDKLTGYRLIFHISMKDVKPDQTIEQLIVEQHKLEGKGVKEQEIHNIITSNTFGEVTF